jgi:DNA-binding beta-propeller fold protein YncE
VKVPLAFIPSEIAANPVTNRIWALDTNGDRVAVIDGATHAFDLVVLPDAPSGIAIDVVHDRAWVLHFSTDQATVIDGATLTPTPSQSATNR